MKITRMARKAGWLAVAGLLGAALIAPAATLAVTGPEVTPTLHDGNITTCPEGQGSTIFIDGSDTSGNADGVTVEIVYDSTAKTVDFTATGGVVWHAFIKGGNAYNDYDYTGLGGVAADDGLVAPDNASGAPAGLSHGVFCVKKTTITTTSSETTSSETTSSETTSTGTSTTSTGTSTTSTGTSTTSTGTSTTSTGTSTTSTGTSTTSTGTSTTSTGTTTASTPSGDVGAETGTPDPTLPSTDTASISGGSTPSSGTWQLLLVAMAALLAGVLLLTPATVTPKR